MKSALIIVAILACGFTSASGQGKLLSNDPLTGLPLHPGTNPGNGLGNRPTQMPEGPICNSKQQSEFYSIYKMKTDDVVSWYASRLAGFKKFSGYASERAQIAFRNSDGTTLVIVTGDKGAKGANVEAYSVAYERYQPGLPEKTVAGLTLGNLDCRSK